MRYAAPTSIDEAVDLLRGEPGLARILAGGTDVLVQLRSGMVEPDLVVDIKRIEGMKTIARTEQGFRIGAAVSGVELGEHAELRTAWPGVVEALELIGSTQIQARATMVGNLCNGSPAADTVPAMIAADARVEIVGPNGTREVPVADVPKGPGKTAIGRDEIVTAVLLPEPAPRSADAYLRFIPRTEMDIAVVSAGVNLTLDESGTCTAARIALGAAAPTVVLVEAAGAALVGSRLDDGALGAMAAAVRAACQPIDDKRGTIDYRTKVSGVLATRAALIARDRAETA